MLDASSTGLNKFKSKIRPEAREIFESRPTNVKLMYTSEQCQMCGAHLTVRQLNRVIIEGAPPVCLKDYKQMKGEIEKLAPLFQQLGLF